MSARDEKFSAFSNLKTITADTLNLVNNSHNLDDNEHLTSISGISDTSLLRNGSLNSPPIRSSSRSKKQKNKAFRWTIFWMFMS